MTHIPTAPVAAAAPQTTRPRFLAAVPSQKDAQLARFGAPSAHVQERRPAGPGHAASESAPPHPAPAAPEPAIRAPLRESPAPVPEARSEVIERKLERLQAAIATLHLQGERLAEQSRADVLEIAFQIAQRIVESELRTSPEPFFAMVRTALKQAGDSRRIRIRVAPQDVELLRGPRGNELVHGVSVAQLEVVADASLQHGDCVVDTDFGHIDGRLATRFQELKRALSATGDAA